MAGDREPPKNRDIDRCEQEHDGHDDEGFASRAIVDEDILQHAGEHQSKQQHPPRDDEEPAPSEGPPPHEAYQRSEQQRRGRS